MKFKPRCLLYVGVLLLALVGRVWFGRAWLAACNWAWEEEYYGLDEVLCAFSHSLLPSKGIRSLPEMLPAGSDSSLRTSRTSTSSSPACRQTMICTCTTPMVSCWKPRREEVRKQNGSFARTNRPDSTMSR